MDQNLQAIRRQWCSAAVVRGSLRHALLHRACCSHGASAKLRAACASMHAVQRITNVRIRWCTPYGRARCCVVQSHRRHRYARVRHALHARAAHAATLQQLAKEARHPRSPPVALPCPALPCPALPCLAVAKTSLRISRPHRCACANQPGVPLLSVPFRCPVPYCCVVLPRCFEVTGAAQVRHLEPDTPADAVGRRRSHTAPAPIRPPLSHNEVRCAITLERRGINSTDGHALPLNRRCC
jgi:hypothetical protein